MKNVCVLMVASGAAWESTALGLLTGRRGVVVLKRCVDVDDLLATATAGQADVAVLALDAHGLDAAAVEHLRRHRVRPVAVTADPTGDPARSRAARIGVATLVGERDLEALPEAVLDADAPETGTPDQVAVTREDVVVPPEASVRVAGTGAGPSAGAAIGPSGGPAGRAGRVVAVWGPAGAPGRTTVALALGAELARRDAPTLVIDADPYGGAVAQQLGVMDEVSGLLSAARLSGSGDLEGLFPTVQRAVSGRLNVITGLPRADRWVEIRAGSVEHILEVGRASGHVIIDTGFSLEDDPGLEFGSLPRRNAMTLAALGAADEIVVVGSADPVGLSRLARGLVELREHTMGAPVRVVVNRMRSSLGWSESDISGMVEGFSRVLGIHYLPDDQGAVDRALIAGHTLVEAGDSALLRAVEDLASHVVPDLSPVVQAGRGFRRRAAGRAPRR
jgi:MinD-like ATPase involved in chromosome partitioning or flagellar assembly